MQERVILGDEFSFEFWGAGNGESVKSYAVDTG